MILLGLATGLSRRTSASATTGIFARSMPLAWTVGSWAMIVSPAAVGHDSRRSNRLVTSWISSPWTTPIRSLLKRQIFMGLALAFAPEAELFVNWLVGEDE